MFIKFFFEKKIKFNIIIIFLALVALLRCQKPAIIREISED